MTRPREIFDPKRLSVCISSKWKKHLEKQAIRLSQREGRKVGVAEVIRRALEVAVPLPGYDIKFKF